MIRWSGYVQSLARPGGNITGIAVHYDEVLTKHVEIATELVPGSNNGLFCCGAE